MVHAYQLSESETFQAMYLSFLQTFFLAFIAKVWFCGLSAKVDLFT